jgi:LysR family transcriptional regulator for metE and metH
MSRLNRSHWQLLLALDELGSLSAAADAVLITQSAATQRLREAERRLGVGLVERVGKSLRLNRSGKRIAAAGRDLEPRLDAAEADAIWLGRNAGPRLRVLQSDYDAQAWLPAFAQTMRAEGAGVEIELIRAAARDGVHPLATGDADAALWPKPVAYPGIEAACLFEEPLAAFVPPDDPLAARDALVPADFAARTYLTYGDMPEAGFEFERFFRPAGAYPQQIVRIESVSAILAFVEAGAGVSILAASSGARARAERRLAQVPLAGLGMTLSWHLLTAASIAEPAAARAAERLHAFLSVRGRP